MYFLVVVKINDNSIEDYRVFGASSSYIKLFKAAIYNQEDIFEQGYYNYALITYIEDVGLYPREVEQQWFKYIGKDPDHSSSAICDKPIDFDKTFILY